MEEIQIESSTPPAITPENPSFFQRFSQAKGKSFLLLFVLLGILALGGGLFAYNTSQNRGNDAQKEQENEQAQFISNNSLIYGYWVSDNAVVGIQDLKTNTSQVAAVLPTNIKHVKIVSPSEFAFIADTNELDHGKSISIQELGSETVSVLFPADEGYGIDDYAVSPNGNYFAIWEVKLSSDSADLLGGSSRVYTFNRSTGQKHVIYDEVFGASVPVHYPIGITDTGELFADRFLANSGAGWAYGMSRSNFSGTQKSEVPSLRNGTYGTQPIMSPDGRYIAYAGYSGTNGAVEVNGYRNAIVAPDTVEMLDTISGATITIRDREENVTYPSVFFDKASNKLFFFEGNFSGENFSLNQFVYNPEINSEIEIANQNTFANKSIVISSLSGNQYLFGNREATSAFLGNLSGKYEQSMRSVFAFNELDKKELLIVMDMSPIQIIGVKESSYFAAGNIQKIAENKENQLQLDTFTIKPELAPKREKLQALPPSIPNQPVGGGCYGYASQMCSREYLFEGAPPSQECIDWINTPGVCADSPLYLYGDEGQKVNVQIGVPLYSPNIPYSPERGVEAVISANGSFYANGKLIEGFSFDYTPGLKKIQRPEYGKVIARSNLEKTLKDYALHFGLNKKETTDLLKEAEKITSHYQFVSFFDHNTSHKILPLYFTPKPDNYRNIVFYIEEFSEKPNLKPKNPKFEPIVRKGLTAVEVSVFLR